MFNRKRNSDYEDYLDYDNNQRKKSWNLMKHVNIRSIQMKHMRRTSGQVKRITPIIKSNKMTSILNMKREVKDMQMMNKKFHMNQIMKVKYQRNIQKRMTSKKQQERVKTMQCQDVRSIMHGSIAS